MKKNASAASIGDITVIKQFADVKTALPNLNGTQLLQVFDHLSSHRTKEITPESLKEYTEVFKARHSLLKSIKELQSSNPLENICGIHRLTELFQEITGITDKTKMPEHLKEFFSHVGHALPLSCAEDPKCFSSAGIEPEKFTALNGLKTALKDSLNSLSENMSPELKGKIELKFSFVNAFMDEIKDHMSTGKDHTAIIDPDAQPSVQMKETADHLVKLEMLNGDKIFGEELDKAVSELDMKGSQARTLARRMIRDLTLCGLANDKNLMDDIMNNYKGVMADVTGRIKNDNMLMNLLSVDAMPPDHLEKVIKNDVLSKKAIIKRFDDELKSSKKAVTTTTIHNIFLRDSLGKNLKIGNNDFSLGLGEAQRKNAAAEAFCKMVPEQFRGFVSTFAMQGGMSNFFARNYEGRNLNNEIIKPQDCLHPMIPDRNTLMTGAKAIIQERVCCDNSLKMRDDHTLEIRTVITLDGGPTANFAGISNQKFLPGNGTSSEYTLKRFDVVNVINFDAGVHNVDGIPNIPVDMKLESITVLDTPNKSNIDF